MAIQKEFLTTPEQVKSFFTATQDEPYIGFDIECQSLDPQAQMAGLSLYSPKLQHAVYIPLHHPGFDVDAETIDILAQSMANRHVKTFNGGFDTLRWEVHFGVAPKVIGDATIVSKMLQLHKFGMKDLALEMGLTESPIRLEDILGDGRFDFTKAPLDQRTLDYTTQDAILAVDVEEGLLNKHFKQEHHPGWDNVYQLELDIMLVLERAGQQGIPVDRPKFQIAVQAMFEEMELLTTEICSELELRPIHRDPLLARPL